MPKFIDLTGQRFGRWTVLRRGTDWRPGHAAFVCRCECGTEKTVRAMSLKQKASKSCGCLNVDVHREVCIQRNTSHGLSQTAEFTCWVNMRQRCHNPRAPHFKKYGAKGTAVCDRWRYSFENFLADMGNRPSPLHTIDRIDNSKGYEPGNCRWATQKEQQNNRSNSRLRLVA